MGEPSPPQPTRSAQPDREKRVQRVCRTDSDASLDKGGRTSRIEPAYISGSCERAHYRRMEQREDLLTRIPQMHMLLGEVRARFWYIVQRNSRQQRGWIWMARQVTQTVLLSGSHSTIASN